MIHTITYMNLDIVEKKSRLPLVLHDFGINKNSSVWKIGLMIAMMKETKLVESKINPILTHLHTILVVDNTTKFSTIVSRDVTTRS